MAFRPPNLFGIVQPGIYRSNAPVDENLPFLARLKLRTVLYLSPEVLLKSVVDFLNGDEHQRKVKLIEHGLESWKPDPSWTPICDEFIKTALELILDVKNHPLLVCCASGILQTAPVVGCLRRLQNWSLTSILDEYRAYAGSKSRLVHQQYIESFDVDLVTLPAQLPSWFVDLNLIEMRSEEEDRAERASLAARVKDLAARADRNEITEDERRLQFQMSCIEAQNSALLVSSRTKYSKSSLVDDDDDD